MPVVDPKLPNFHLLFEGLPGLYLLLQPDFVIAAVTETYLKATMTQRKAILGRGIFEVFPDNPNEPGATGTSNLRASLERVRRNRVPDAMAVQKYDIRCPESEGGAFEVRYWSPVNSPIFDSTGELSHILHQVEDVTEFVKLRLQEEEQGKINEKLKSKALQMEKDIYNRAQELQEANKQLRAAYEEQDRFFSVSLDMLCISSYDGHFKKVNPAFEDTLGFSREELCAKSYLEFIHPDDIEITKKEVEKQLVTKSPVLNFENRYRCKDGSYRLLSWKSAPVGDLMYAAARDITESKRIERELSLAKDAAEIANKELESFSYSVAHDLRAPLRGIMGFGDVLLEDYGDSLPKEGKDVLLRTINAAKKMGNLIDGLLDLSRVTRKEITKQPVNLSEMARDIVGELRHGEPTREVEAVIAEGVTVQGDPLLLHQVLANLLSNAWKYSAKNPGKARIEFGVSEEGYFVKDNGTGFDMKYVNKLFGVFQRLHTAQEFEGTGIGLAIVKRIIQSHGGNVRAQSSLGEGATFYFTIGR